MSPRTLTRPFLLVAALATALSGCGGGGGGGGGTPTPSTPAITTQPRSVVGKVGQPASFTIVARGQGPLDYQWYKNGIGIVGAKSATYTIASVAESSVGVYKCLVADVDGDETSSAEAALTLNGAVAPSITTNPTSRSATVGSSTTFRVAAAGTQPFTYRWLKNGVPISGETSASYTIDSVRTSDAGNYSVTVMNENGSVTSGEATLTIVSLPTITTQPVSQEANEGTTVELSVVATGGDLHYQWFRGTIPLARSTQATYTFGATSTNAGSYTVKITNGAGTVTSDAAVVNVHLKPVIVTAPTSRSIIAGTNTTFNVTATGEGTLTYQWYVDGVAVAGQTGSSFTFTNVPQKPAVGTPPQSPPYLVYVLVTNSVGSTASSVARLTVQ